MLNKKNDDNSKNLTGYPSIDKPWLKYYDEESIKKDIPMISLYENILLNNKEHKNDIALRYFGTQISYGELLERIEEAASAFSSLGVKKGDIVTIMSMQTPEAIYALYGLNYIGAVANMVYMTLSSEEIVRTVKETDSKALLVLEVASKKIDEIVGRLNIPVYMLSITNSMPVPMRIAYRIKNPKPSNYLWWSDFIKNGNEKLVSPTQNNGKGLAVIVYTSGSTGDPKGVMLSNYAINAHATQDINGLIDFRRRLSMIFILPPFLGYGISHLHTVLSSGIDLILQIQIDPEIVAKSIYKHNPNVFLGTPAYMEAVMASKFKNKTLNKMIYFFAGGGEVSEKKEIEFDDYLSNHNARAKYSAGYGMTETTSTLCCNCNELKKVGSVGIPFFMTNVKVIDRTTGEELKYGKEGELHFSSPNMMDGYFHNESATNEVLYEQDGTTWIRSGDLGYVDEDGFVFVTGRIKRICFTRAKDGFSYKLFPQRIEELLQKDSDIEHCGVITKEDEERINVAVAFVTIRDKSLSQEKRDAIRTRLFELSAVELPEHEQPVDIIIIDSMPLTLSGKIDFRALGKRFVE